MVQTLRAGMAAPDFVLKDAEGAAWRLSDLRGKRVILYFYPEDDTPGCTAQACDFRDERAALQRAGYVVFGVSPQGAESHRAFASKYGLNFPLLVDEDLAVATRYGAVKDGGGSRPRVKRSTFVINERGLVVEALYGVAATGHVEALIRALGV